MVISRSFALVLFLASQNSLETILVKKLGDHTPNPQNEVTFLAECFKLLFCLVCANKKKWSVNVWDSTLPTISVLYLLQNSLKIFSQSTLDPFSFTVISQLKVMFAMLGGFFILHSKYPSRMVVWAVLLTLSAITVFASDLKDGEHSDVISIATGLLAMSLSGVNGSIVQRYLQTSKHSGIQQIFEKNICMSLWSLSCILVIRGYKLRWDVCLNVPLIVTSMVVGIGGILVAVLVSLYGNVSKSVSSMLSSVILFSYSSPSIDGRLFAAVLCVVAAFKLEKSKDESQTYLHAVQCSYLQLFVVVGLIASNMNGLQMGRLNAIEEPVAFTRNVTLEKWIPYAPNDVFSFSYLFKRPHNNEKGLLFTVYSLDNDTFSMYFNQAVLSINKAKTACPKIPIALAVGPRTPDSGKLQNVDIAYYIPESLILTGRSDRNDKHLRQWMTRMITFHAFPFDVTIAVDATTELCSCALLDEMESTRKRNIDVLLAQQVRHSVPHGWFVGFRRTAFTKLLFERWVFEQLQRGYNRDDQHTLNYALQWARKKNIPITVRWTPAHVALALTPTKVGDNVTIRMTRPFKDTVQLFHSGVQNPCGKVNVNVTQRRLYVSTAKGQRLVFSKKDCQTKVKQDTGLGFKCSEFDTPIPT